MTRFHVQHKSVFSANELSQDILFIGSAPRPQALILLKIAPAARTYGLHLCTGARFSKVPIINGPGKLSPFTLKIEVSIVLHLT